MRTGKIDGNAFQLQDLPPLVFDRKRYQAAKNCPCGKSNRDGKFVPYKGFNDKGYCHSCGETFLPEIDKSSVSSFQTLRVRKQETPKKPVSFMNAEVLKATMKGYDSNVFVQFLIHLFGADTVEALVGKYLVGTTKQGSPIFWHVDIKGRVRTGKIIPYHTDGKRVKDAKPPVRWAHTEMKLSDFNKEICLFGEHLLKGNSAPCAIVESEKTAMIASLYFPRFIWLACGGMDGLLTHKLEVLKDRPVTLFPDIEGYSNWANRAQELDPMLNIKVSDFLERIASDEERKEKLDLADYLLKFPLSEFVGPAGQEPEYDFAGNLIDPVLGYPVTWKSAPKTDLQRMLDRHPTLENLIERLDLVEI